MESYKKIIIIGLCILQISLLKAASEEDFMEDPAFQAVLAESLAAHQAQQTASAVGSVEQQYAPEIQAAIVASLESPEDRAMQAALAESERQAQQKEQQSNLLEAVNRILIETHGESDIATQEDVDLASVLALSEGLNGNDAEIVAQKIYDSRAGAATGSSEPIQPPVVRELTREEKRRLAEDAARRRLEASAVPAASPQGSAQEAAVVPVSAVVSASSGGAQAAVAVPIPVLAAPVVSTKKTPREKLSAAQDIVLHGLRLARQQSAPSNMDQSIEFLNWLANVTDGGLDITQADIDQRLGMAGFVEGVLRNEMQNTINYINGWLQTNPSLVASGIKPILEKLIALKRAYDDFWFKRVGSLGGTPTSGLKISQRNIIDFSDIERMQKDLEQEEIRYRTAQAQANVFQQELERDVAARTEEERQEMLKRLKAERDSLKRSLAFAQASKILEENPNALDQAYAVLRAAGIDPLEVQPPAPAAAPVATAQQAESSVLVGMTEEEKIALLEFAKIWGQEKYECPVCLQEFPLENINMHGVGEGHHFAGCAECFKKLRKDAAGGTECPQCRGKIFKIDLEEQPKIFKEKLEKAKAVEKEMRQTEPEITRAVDDTFDKFRGKSKAELVAEQENLLKKIEALEKKKVSVKQDSDADPDNVKLLKSYNRLLSNIIKLKRELNFLQSILKNKKK